MKKTNIPIEIDSASVRVMRSYDYSHFEVCLTSSSVTTPQGVNELRKEAARLADAAVYQYIIAKAVAGRKAEMQQQWLLAQAEAKPEGERTAEEMAIIKYHSDAAFAAQFDYDYEDEWDLP